MADSSARALAFNAVAPALDESGHWLPLSVRQRVADAVLAAIEPDREAMEAALYGATSALSAAHGMRAEMRALLEEALHLRTNGERAPGGNETWGEWERRAEAFLRSLPVRRIDGDMSAPAGRITDGSE